MKYNATFIQSLSCHLGQSLGINREFNHFLSHFSTFVQNIIKRSSPFSCLNNFAFFGLDNLAQSSLQKISNRRNRNFERDTQLRISQIRSERNNFLQETKSCQPEGIDKLFKLSIILRNFYIFHPKKFQNFNQIFKTLK